MALSNASYLGDGSNVLYSVSFPYLSKSHVEVLIDGVSDLGFTWETDSVIRTSTVAPSGAIVKLLRNTPTSPLVDFVDGSTLTEDLLDTSTQQSLLVAEESKDSLAGLIVLDLLDNKFEGTGRVIKNVANPVNPQDVATKSWSESAVSSSVAQAATSANNAQTSAVTATNQAVISTTQAGISTSQAGIATTQASITTTQAGIASTKASEANTSAINAGNSASTATVKASEASSSVTLATTQAGIATTKASEADTSAGIASTKASEANVSAINAAQSASDALAVAGSFTLANRAEAEAGVDNVKYLSSLRVKQAIQANVPPAFEAGTRLTFNQSTAPVGWTKDTTAALNDSIMRIVTGSVVGGGSTAFTTFNGQTSVGDTTLSLDQTPSHSHSSNIVAAGNGGSPRNVYSTSNSPNTAQLPTNAQGGGSSHTHSISNNIKYNDFIIAKKD